MLGIDFGSWLGDIANWILTPISSAFQWILSQAWAFIGYLWSLIPVPTSWPGPDVAAAITFIISYIQQPLTAVNYYIPVNLMIVLLTICLAEEGILATWHAVRWIISHLPWVGGDV